MSGEPANKILVKRPRKVSTDERGRSVWVEPVESEDLELVSTQMLKVMLSSRNPTDRDAIAEAADNATDGVLARDPNNGQFEIISDDDLQAILDDNQGLPKLTRPADATLEPLRDYADDSELSLVSTQALRKVLDGGSNAEEGMEDMQQDAAGFNPYDRH